MAFFRLVGQILQSKSGIFGEKFNEASREKGFFIAKAAHRNKSNKIEVVFGHPVACALPGK